MGNIGLKETVCFVLIFILGIWQGFDINSAVYEEIRNASIKNIETISATYENLLNHGSEWLNRTEKLYNRLRSYAVNPFQFIPKEKELIEC